ncbi:MAG: SGNH/GDSL hydrolase family protein [Bacteroidaceae bacterium]|nr:SGNH/GDSL hydrolase family protein [Bacteroidaceae bacterium]
MKKLIILLILMVSGQWSMVNGQTWYDASEGGFHIFGQGWPQLSQKKFQRLPITEKSKLNNGILWNASQLSAGLYVRFRTDATSISVRFTLTKQAVQHYNISSFGQSGVDLYARSDDGKTFHWLGNHLNYGFGTPATANFRNIVPQNMEGNKVCEYTLYMPNFNGVSKLEVGVNEGASFQFIEVPEDDEPIVVYGSSAVQGSSASRPGNSWTNMLGRELDAQVVNLGFADHAKLDEGIFRVMAGLKPRVFIIDAMPDMKAVPQLIKERIVAGVKLLQAMTNRPVLLVESPGAPDRLIRPAEEELHTRANEQLREAYDQLTQDGYTNLFYMSQEELGLNEEDFLDGINPTDLGMKHYAAAYAKKLAYIEENKDPIIDAVEAVEYNFRTPELPNSRTVYDLQGRKISIPSGQLPKGLYIINGKKTVITAQ